MSFASMSGEVKGAVPKIPFDYCYTLVNRARQDAYRQNLWSFLTFESNWTSPAWIQAGTVSVTQGSPTITFDSTASAAIYAQYLQPPSAITQRQFRIGVGTIYNIWAANYSNTSAIVLTLDRNYQEPTATLQPYTILQCYYAAPVQDFWCWVSIRDMLNYNDLIYTKSRAWIDARDPQRSIYYIPTHCVPYQLDQNPASPTYQWQLFELWGQPSYVLTYQLYGIRKGVALVNDSDTMPPQIGEDCVIALATKYGYQWAEANKGDIPRGAGSDYRFLIGEVAKDYSRLFSDYRRQDRSTMDNWRTRARPRHGWGWWGAYYNGINATANPGGFFQG